MNGRLTYEGRSLSAAHIVDALHIREAVGFLTVDETIERYGIDREIVEGAVAGAVVCSVTFQCADGSEATFLPTRDGAVVEWLEAVSTGTP